MKRFIVYFGGDKCPTCGAQQGESEKVAVAYPEDVAASPSAGIRAAYRRGYRAGRTGDARTCDYAPSGFGYGLRIAFFRGYDDAKAAAGRGSAKRRPWVASAVRL